MDFLELMFAPLPEVERKPVTGTYPILCERRKELYEKKVCEYIKRNRNKVNRKIMNQEVERLISKARGKNDIKSN